MKTIVAALSISFALVASSFVVGCAAPANGDEEPLSPTTALTAEANDDDLKLGTQTQALTLTPVVQPTTTVPTLPPMTIIMPECRAVLISTTPAPENGGSNYPSCDLGADPHTAQRRIAGYIEGTITDLRDQAIPGRLVCTPSPIKGGAPRCEMSKDRLAEKLCEETRIYECPCGVATKMIDGAPAGYCRGIR